MRLTTSTIKHGKNISTYVLILFSCLFIAHFLSEHFYKKSLVNLLFAPQQLMVKNTYATVPMPPPPGASSEPKGGSASSGSKPENTVKVEVFGLIKFEINETNSWQTIGKILTVILGTFLGIRAINAVFNRLETKTAS